MHNWIHIFEFGIRLCNKYSTVNNFNKSGWDAGVGGRGSMQLGATPGLACQWGSGRLTVGRQGRGLGGGRSFPGGSPHGACGWTRTGAWRAQDGGNIKYPQKKCRLGMVVGVLCWEGGLNGFGGEPASPLVWMWINLILGSISLHVTNSLHAEYF